MSTLNAAEARTADQARPAAEPALHARYASAEFEGEPPAEFMYMPGGVHTVWLGRGGKPAQVTVEVTAATAAALQASLDQLVEERAPQRPYFDFEHRGDEASAWPVRFAWRTTPEPGVYVAVEWSKDGRDAVLGKVHRAFSPVFFADAKFPPVPAAAKEVTVPDGQRGSKQNPATVTGCAFVAGSLTNQPAFRKILPLWAKESTAAAGEETKGGTTAEQQGARSMKVKLIRARGGNAAGTIVELPEADAVQALTAGDAITESTAELLSGKDLQIQQQGQALQARRQADAAAKVAAAVARGAIEPKNEALQAKWRGLIETDAANAELLDALPGTDKAALAARQTTAAPAGGEIQVGRADVRDALKSFRVAREASGLQGNPLQGKQAALEAGQIYAREISPILNKADGSLPLEATDTLVTDIVSQRTLEFLRYKFPLLERISTRFSTEQLKVSQNVIVRTVTPPDVVSYNTTTGWPNSTTAAEDVTVPMTAQKAVQIRFQSDQLSGTNRRLFDEQAAPAAYSIKKDLMDLVSALVTTAFFNTAVVKALADFNRKTVIAVANGMKKAAIPMFNPFLLLSTDYYDKLAEDDTVVSRALAESALQMESGELRPVHGLQPIEIQNESWAGTIEGFGAIPSSLCAATALPLDYTTVFPGVNAGGMVRVVTDAEIGLSLMEVKFINHQLADAYMRLAYMRGAARGPVTHGVLLKSA